MHLQNVVKWLELAQGIKHVSVFRSDPNGTFMWWYNEHQPRRDFPEASEIVLNNRSEFLPPANEIAGR